MPRHWDEGSDRNLRQADPLRDIAFPRYDIEIGRGLTRRPAPPVRKSENEVISALLRLERQERKRSAIESMVRISDREFGYHPFGNRGIPPYLVIRP